MTANANSASSNLARALRTKFQSFAKTFYFYTRSPIATIGLIIVLFYVLVAIFGPIVLGGNPWRMTQYLSYHGQYIYNIPQPP